MNKLIIIAAHIILIVLVVIVTFGCEKAEPKPESGVVIDSVIYNDSIFYVLRTVHADVAPDDEEAYLMHEGAVPRGYGKGFTFDRSELKISEDSAR